MSAPEEIGKSYLGFMFCLLEFFSLPPEWLLGHLEEICLAQGNPPSDLPHTTPASVVVEEAQPYPSKAVQYGVHVLYILGMHNDSHMDR